MSKELSFSQRNGFEEIRNKIQKEDLDQKTRNSLWNLFYENYSYVDHYNFFKYYWMEFCCNRIDEIPTSKIYKIGRLKKVPLTEKEALEEHYYIYFFYKEINEFFDFLEKAFDFVRYFNKEKFTNSLNKILEKEKVVYRFVQGMFIENEFNEQNKHIEEISNELSCNNLTTSSDHFNKAFNCLYDREKPDYKTSLSESIQFLEALIGFKLNKAKGKIQLSTLLKELRYNYKNSDFEFDVIDVWDKIYGKMSNQGIRHSNGEYKIKIEADFNQARLIFHLAMSIASFLLANDFNNLKNK